MSVLLKVVGEWRFSLIHCDILLTLDVMMCTASILNLCAISIDRWILQITLLSYYSLVLLFIECLTNPHSTSFSLFLLRKRPFSFHPEWEWKQQRWQGINNWFLNCALSPNLDINWCSLGYRQYFGNKSFLQLDTSHPVIICLSFSRKLQASLHLLLCPLSSH